MTNDRLERIDAIAAELNIVGELDSTGQDEAKADPGRFLLVEKNVGSASHMQSHFISTHETLETASNYHIGQEYIEDWQIVFAIDLDTGQRFDGEITQVAWTPTGLPDPPEDLRDAWARYQRGEHVEGYEQRALDEWRGDVAEEAGY